MTDFIYIKGINDYKCLLIIMHAFLLGNKYFKEVADIFPLTEDKPRFRKVSRVGLSNMLPAPNQL